MEYYNLQTEMRPHLGLVCITHSDEVRYRTITRTRYLKLIPAEQERTLRELYTDNLARLNKALTFCNEHSIKLYRLTSSLFPQSDDELGGKILEEMAPELGLIGKRAEQCGIRIVAHPEQFVVLNSESPKVIENSILVLNQQARIFDLLGLARSAWATMMIHGGKGGRPDQLVEMVGKLAEPVRSRIAFENDEHAYSAYDVLDICRRAGVPMVFDAHHHTCNAGLDSYDDPSIGEILIAARETWPNPNWQLVHLSNGREGISDRSHSEIITQVPISFRFAPWIEVEAKNKEQAIELLRQSWPLAD